MYDEILLERSSHPEFRGDLKGVKSISLVNSSCGDELLIYLKVQDGKILDGRFSGVGCAISQASADLFIATVKGKTVLEAKKLFNQFKTMILGGSGDFSGLFEAEAMKCVSRMPARVKCAELAWKSLEMV